MRDVVAMCAPIGELEKKKKLVRTQRIEQERNVSVLLAHFEKAKKALDQETKLLELLYERDPTCNCSCPLHCAQKTRGISQLRQGDFREGLKQIEGEEMKQT